MDFHYTQVEDKAAEQMARPLGALLGIHWQHALGMLWSLWKWGRELRDERGRPHGVCEHRQALLRMASAVEWAGDREQLVTALQDVEAVERLPHGGLRVRGVEERYGVAWDDRQKDKDNGRRGGQVSAAKRKGARQPPNPSGGSTPPSTQASTPGASPPSSGGATKGDEGDQGEENKKNAAAAPLAAAGLEGCATSPPQSQPAAAGKDTAWWERWQRVRRAVFHEYAHDESKPFEGALLHWYPKACADAGGPEALERAFIRYCLSDFAEGLTQPGSARVFMRPDVWVKDIAPRMARRCSCPRSHFELQLGGREEPTHRPECPAGDAERVEVSVAKLVSWLQAGEVAA